MHTAYSIISHFCVIIIELASKEEFSQLKQRSSTKKLTRRPKWCVSLRRNSDAQFEKELVNQNIKLMQLCNMYDIHEVITKHMI